MHKNGNLETSARRIESELIQTGTALEAMAMLLKHVDIDRLKESIDLGTFLDGIGVLAATISVRLIETADAVSDFPAAGQHG